MANDHTKVDLGEDLIGKIQVQEPELSVPSSGESKQPVAELEPTVMLSVDHDLFSEVQEIKAAGVVPLDFAPEFFIPIEDQEEVTSIRVESESDEDRIEAVKILIQEGLLDEAKKHLYKIRSRQANHPEVKQYLSQIEQIEIQDLYRPQRKKRNQFEPIEDSASVIDGLGKELGLGAYDQKIQHAVWKTQSKEPLDINEFIDLGLGFFEMGCYEDAYREYSRALKRIRVEQSDLDDRAVSCVIMIAKSLKELDRPFEAKNELNEILNDPGLSLEGRLAIMYVLAECELADGQKEEARSWFARIIALAPTYRDVKIRIRELPVHLK